MLFFSLSTLGLLGSWLSPAANAESPACEQATSLIELIEAHDAALKALEAFDQEALLLAAALSPGCFQGTREHVGPKEEPMCDAHSQTWCP